MQQGVRAACCVTIAQHMNLIRSGFPYATFQNGAHGFVERRVSEISGTLSMTENAALNKYDESSRQKTKPSDRLRTLVFGLQSSGTRGLADSRLISLDPAHAADYRIAHTRLVTATMKRVGHDIQGPYREQSLHPGEGDGPDLVFYLFR